MQRQEEEEKKEQKNNPSPSGKQDSQMAKTGKLILANLIFFAVVAGGLMLVSGRSLTDLLGLSYWAAKSKDDSGL
jgi:hypothetical protein